MNYRNKIKEKIGMKKIMYIQCQSVACFQSKSCQQALI